MSERLRVIANRAVRLEIVRRWRQTEEYVIRDRGRWGPKWLARVVSRMATNLGMVGHMACYEAMQTVSTKTIDVKGKELGQQVHELARPFLHDGYRPEELQILCGPDWLMDLRGSLVGRGMVFEAQAYLGGIDSRPKFYGFRIAVVDHLEGAIVVPKAVLR